MNQFVSEIIKKKNKSQINRKVINEIMFQWREKIQVVDGEENTIITVFLFLFILAFLLFQTSYLELCQIYFVDATFVH